MNHSQSVQIQQFETERLIMRQWKNSDLSDFAQLNGNDEVMRFFPFILSRDESDKMAERIRSLIAQKGWGFWALEEKCSGQFIGFTGLHTVADEMPFAPAVEIGWRLGKGFWGKGYATEAATQALRHAFGELNLSHVVSFTAVINEPSRRVMERLGMKNTSENFYHPKVDAHSQLAEHVLYKMSRTQWLEKP